MKGKFRTHPVFRGTPTRLALLGPPMTWTVLMRWLGDVPPRARAKLWEEFSRDRGLAWYVWTLDRKLQRRDTRIHNDLWRLFQRLDPGRLMDALEGMATEGALTRAQTSAIETRFLDKLNREGQ
jgi:hypothetical protein